MLHHEVLRYIVLSYATLRYVTLRYVALHCVELYVVLYQDSARDSAVLMDTELSEKLDELLGVIHNGPKPQRGKNKIYQAASYHDNQNKRRR